MLDPNEPAGQATLPGTEGGAATPEPSATPAPTPQAKDGGGSGAAIVLPGVAGLLIGAAGGFAAMRGRRR